jgi:hypothetical protein
MLFSPVLVLTEPRAAAPHPRLSPLSVRSLRSLSALCVSALDFPASPLRNRYRDENRAAVTPLDSAFLPRAHARGTNAVTRKSFVMCIYENTGGYILQTKNLFLPVRNSVHFTSFVFKQFQMLFLQPFSFQTITNAPGVDPFALPLSRHASLSLLKSTLLKVYVNKGLYLPLDSTLTKNRGRGAGYG